MEFNEYTLKIAKVIAAAFATISLSGIGKAIGNVFCTLIDSVARNPSARDKMFTIGILGAALVETVALLAILIAFLILFS